MENLKPVPKLYFHLGALAKRWEQSIEELLSRAVAGDLPVMIPHYAPEQGNLVVGMGPDPDQFPEMIHPEWAVGLKPEDLQTVAQYGEVSIKFASRFVADGLMTFAYDPPRKITRDDLVVPADHVTAIEAETEQPLGESERATLLRSIGALAMAIAGDTDAYYYGGSPNATGIAKGVTTKIGTCPPEFKDKFQCGANFEEQLRKKVGLGIKLFLGEK